MRPKPVASKKARQWEADKRLVTSSAMSTSISMTQPPPEASAMAASQTLILSTASAPPAGGPP